MRKPLLLLFTLIVSLSSLAGCSNASDAVVLADLKPQQALVEIRQGTQSRPKDLTGLKSTELSVSPSSSSFPTARAVLESPIVRTAYLSLDQASKDSCLDWMAAEVGSYAVSCGTVVWSTLGVASLDAQLVWRVTFRTEDEWVLGAINVYVDKESGKALGCALRY